MASVRSRSCRLSYCSGDASPTRARSLTRSANLHVQPVAVALFARVAPKPVNATMTPKTNARSRWTRRSGMYCGCFAPAERACVVLKDVLGYTLTDIAELLETTVGSVKAARHRGRVKAGAVGATGPPH